MILILHRCVRFPLPFESIAKASRRRLSAEGLTNLHLKSQVSDVRAAASRLSHRSFAQCDCSLWAARLSSLATSSPNPPIDHLNDAVAALSKAHVVGDEHETG